MADVLIISAIFGTFLVAVILLARAAGGSNAREKGLRDTVEQMARIEKAKSEPRLDKRDVIDRLRDGKF